MALEDPLMISVVIPTFNAAKGITATLRCLPGKSREIIVADGGSTDETIPIARTMGATVLHAERGRGNQLVAGAKAARGDWLLFLHGDTCLEPNWDHCVNAFVCEPSNTWRAAVFNFAVDDETPQARILEARVMWRTRFLGLPYGDQGLLISRQFYDALGGYRLLPLMEDVDLVRRIGSDRISILPARAITSAERWRQDGWRRRSLRNLMCLTLYLLGVSPRMIARLYE